MTVMLKNVRAPCGRGVIVTVTGAGGAGSWMRSISRSPSAHGASGTVHVSAVVLALSLVRLRVVVPVVSMKSMA